MKRGAKDEFGPGVEEIKFLRLDLDVGLFFRLFALRNLFAEAAGVFAVEGAPEGGLPGVGLEIFREHRAPRDRLQRQPMRATGRQGGNEHH